MEDVGSPTSVAPPGDVRQEEQMSLMPGFLKFKTKIVSGTPSNA